VTSLLFPPFVVLRSATFDPNDARAAEERFPGIVLPEALRHAVAKRQVEFLAGRWCVREALRACGHPEADAPVRQGARREPLFPEGIVGSITHAHGRASAAVARREDARGVGLDAERPMSGEQAERLLDLIAAPEEIAALERATGWDRGKVFAIVFSAKETIFKCLYTEVGRYFDFRDAEVVALEDGTFRAHLLVPLAASLPSGTTLEGRFTLADGLVWTAMVLPP
jgi:enterobactin synthetase component D